jgi:hypothetical protein
LPFFHFRRCFTLMLDIFFAFISPLIYDIFAILLSPHYSVSHAAAGCDAAMRMPRRDAAQSRHYATAMLPRASMIWLAARCAATRLPPAAAARAAIRAPCAPNIADGAAAD